MPQEGQTTTAMTHQNEPQLNNGFIQGGGIVTAIFSIAGGLMWLRRKLSSDKLAIKKDGSEASLMEALISERNRALDEARDAWARRAADAETIGKLSSEVRALSQLNHRTNNEVHLLRLLNERQEKELEALREKIANIEKNLPWCEDCPKRRMNEHQVNQ